MRIAVSLCTFLALTGSAFAQFTIEQVMSAPYTSNLTAAKNAPRIAWTFNLKGERNVWIADAPAFKARQVTRYRGDDGVPISSVRLTPDGRTAVYVRGGPTNGAGFSPDAASSGKEIKQQVWAVDVDGGEPRLLGDMACHHNGCEDVQLSPDGKTAAWVGQRKLWSAPVYADGKKIEPRQLHFLRGTPDDVKWSPDGTRLAFTLSRDNDDHRFLVLYDVASESVRYVAPSSDRSLYPRWSPDGKQLAFLRVGGREIKLPLIPEHPEPWSIWVADAASGAARQIWRSGKGAADSFPHFAEESFAFASGRVIFASEHDGRSHLYSIAPAGGDPVLLTPGEFDVEDVALSHDHRAVVYSSNQVTADPLDRDRRHIWRVPVSGGKPEPLTSGASMEWKPTALADGKTVCFIASTAQRPGLPACGQTVIGAELVPGEFPAAQLVSPKQVIFKSEDGLTIHGQLFAPPRQSKPGPAIIYTHGGPPRQMMLGYHYSHYYHAAYAANQYLASLGYTVLSVNYRLGIMYGRAFREAQNASWRGASEYKDVLAGARFLMTLPNVDRNRIGLWGGSYGGYLTALGLARNSEMFKAGVDVHGVHDWSVFLPSWEDDTRNAPDLKEAQKLAWDSSPNSSVATWKSPVLLIHGDDDRNVPFSQTTDLTQRLRKQGVEVEELVYPDDVHDFLLWRNWVHAYKEMGAYFDKHLKK